MARKRGTNDKASCLRYIPCQAEPGIFRGEFLVFVKAVDPSAPAQTIPVQLLVDHNEVANLEGKPALNQPAVPLGESMFVAEDTLRTEVHS